jgi:two-component system OmpR family sensor kinase/two-component system sensor histidine kinase BaeS
MTSTSVRSIRRRLFVLLLSSFAIVVLLMAVFLLVFTGYFLRSAPNQGPFFQSPLAHSLEIYFLTHGSWGGVQEMFARDVVPPSEMPPRWERSLLLDENDRVLADRGRVDTPLAGTIYQVRPGDMTISLQARGVPVGKLVFEQGEANTPWQSVLRLLRPIILFSLFPAVLTLIIGMLLTRRFVAPLSEVISAAQLVAGGDLSTRVQVRGPDDLRALSDSFNQMADALERNDHERRDMLADIAHELRTPLTVIRGRLEGIVDRVYSADDDQIAQVLEQSYLLERLVEDLRLLTLAESRQLHFERRQVDLSVLAEKATSLFEAEAAEKEIDLTLEIEPKLPPINADPQRVEQVISNLLGNALHYALTPGKITVCVTNSTAGVELTVSDNGPGVTETDLPHIFDRFWREEKSRSRVGGGAGLGLAIARQLIEAQGGTIYARNQPGGGLQVGFVLPVML